MYKSSLFSNDYLNDSSPSPRNMQSVFFQPVPWRRITGTVNRRALDRLAGALLSHCMTLPGSTLAAVQHHFHPMLTVLQVHLLIEVRGCSW